MRTDLNECIGVFYEVYKCYFKYRTMEMNDIDIDQLLKVLPKLIRENDAVKGVVISALAGMDDARSKRTSKKGIKAMPAKVEDLELKLENDRQKIFSMESMTFDQQTWERAASIVRLVIQASIALHMVLVLPDMLPDSDGGLSISWRGARFELLIDVPRYPKAEVTLYGVDNNQENEIDVKCGIDLVAALILEWLKKVA